MRRSGPASERNPTWYKDAIIYELRVRSFFDGNGDGIGDFAGLTEKLDYLEDLGVTVLWLLPFYPSPLRDDGYDIADYTSVRKDCGTLSDFKAFLKEAHARGFRVVTELVLNHTSDQHPWFQRARRAPPGSPEREFYVWSDTTERYTDARIIFQDFEPSNWTWDPVAKAYYWHRFYQYQPDLNYDNPLVHKAMLKALDFWLELGVDGLRLDAIPYLYQREGTSCENLPETHAFLKKLRRHIDSKFEDRMLVAEANQWPEDAAAYLAPDECQMAFHFPIMPRMFMAVHMEDRLPITDILDQTPALADASQWALFLRNHDELTLEMVSEEERDYMYRAYARDHRMRLNLGIRRRLAPLLGSNRRTIELLNGLLFSLPGTPVVYYGDEIGMGDNVYLGDRDGVRTPMQWSADRNAGFSRANPQRLILPVVTDPQYHFETTNVEAQEQSRNSLLWWTRRIIALRKRHKAFGRGTIEWVSTPNHKVLAFVRRFENEHILVIANLSRLAQYADLDLSAFKGAAPRELFAHTRFPRVEEGPYRVMLGPHDFYWFLLESREEVPGHTGTSGFFPAHLHAKGTWEGYVRGEQKETLERVLPGYLARCRWFLGKGRAVSAVRFVEELPLNGGTHAWLGLVEVQYAEGESETYLLPLAFVTGDRLKQIQSSEPGALIAQLTLTEKGGDNTGAVVDATADPEFAVHALGLLDRKRKVRGASGETAAALLSDPGLQRRADAEPHVTQAGPAGTSIVYGERVTLDLFRKLDDGPSPAVEIGRVLTLREFSGVPRLFGQLEYRSEPKAPLTLGVLHAFVPYRTDGWRYAQEEIRPFFERVLTNKSVALPDVNVPVLALAGVQPEREVSDLFGSYLAAARLLGRRTAELHVALASEKGDPDFVPEAYSSLHQRATYQSMRSLVAQTCRALRGRLDVLPPEAGVAAASLLADESRMVRHLGAFLDRRITAVRTRCHGDFHLGQVLYTGKDFLFVGFEGSPSRPLSERRRKRSPLRDVAGMLRSFHHAAESVLRAQAERGIFGEKERAILEPWAEVWRAFASGAFLGQYLASAGAAPFVPADPQELRMLLDAFTMEAALAELGHELEARPSWVSVPIRGIQQILEMQDGEDATDDAQAGPGDDDG